MKILYIFLVLILSTSVFCDDFNNSITEYYIANQNKNCKNIDLETKVYNRFKKTNTECLSKLNLTKNQEERINKLQNKYIKIAKNQGIELNKYYKDYKEAYKIDPNSSNTKKKKEKLKEIVAETKKDYYAYQEELFKILSKSQQDVYKKYIEKELNSIKEKREKNIKKNKEG